MHRAIVLAGNRASARRSEPPARNRVVMFLEHRKASGPIPARARSLSSIVFLFLSFGIAGPALFFARPGAPVVLQLVLLILASYAPAIGATVAIAVARDSAETASFRQRLTKWRVSRSLYVGAVLLPSLIWLAAALANQTAGNPQSFQWANLLAFPIVLLTSWGEEVGWRGFALPRLLSRFSPLYASLALGIGWGLFHFPLYWQRPLFAAVFLVATPALAIIVTRFFLASGESVPVCTLFHAAYNAWAQALLPSEFGEGLLAILAGLLWIVAVYFILRNGVDPAHQEASRRAWR